MYYILHNREIVRAIDVMTWARWFESDERIVDLEVRDGVRVSTIFLGLDHNFGGGRPLLFETMIFGGEHDQYQARCSTWEQAEAMHADAMRLAFGEPLLLTFQSVA